MNSPTRKTINKIKEEIKKGDLLGDYGDYILMTKLWKCTPSEFENQTEYNIMLHKNIFSLENRMQQKEDRKEYLKNKARQYGN